jgi:hypothetical protein
MERYSTHLFWFRRKYSLPPNDERFLALEPWECYLDLKMHEYFDMLESGKHPTEEFHSDENVEEMMDLIGNEDAWEEMSLKDFLE